MHAKLARTDCCATANRGCKITRRANEAMQNSRAYRGAMNEERCKFLTDKTTTTTSKTLLGA